jgi:sugar/nucleoside kinase (ribokinase family)
MYARDGKDLVQVFQAVKGIGITTSLDMVMVDKNSAAGQANWEKILQRTLPHVDLFMPSIDEILLLLGYNHGRSLWIGQEEIDEVLKPEFLRDLSDQMLAWGAGMVLFKLGENGAYLRTNNRARFASIGSAAPGDVTQWADREIWSPIFRLDRFGGTTGAGDSASAGFMTALLKGAPPEQALMMACAVGACNVEEPDALSGLMTWEETIERVQRGWERLPREIHESQWHVHPATQTWLGPFDGKPILNKY